MAIPFLAPWGHFAWGQTGCCSGCSKEHLYHITLGTLLSFWSLRKPQGERALFHAPTACEAMFAFVTPFAEWMTSLPPSGREGVLCWSHPLGVRG